MKTIVPVLISFCSIALVSAQNEIKIDTSASLVKWTGSNLFKFNQHYGTVNFKNGVILINNDSISGGSFEIDMNSIINTDGKYNEMLVSHLKNEDFFNVEKYPNAKLDITHIKYTDSVNLEIKAKLTIKNITKPIEYRASLKYLNDRMALTAKFIIDRTRWKVNYGSKSFLDGLKDDTISDAIGFDVITTTEKVRQ